MTAADDDARTAPRITESAPGIPFPRTEQPTACQTNPARFSHDSSSGGSAAADVARDVRLAREDCALCPIVTGCLKWALANPKLTTVGVWAATTKRERSTLRRRQVERLGPDWVAKVAAADRRRAERGRSAGRAPRTTPPGNSPISPSPSPAPAAATTTMPSAAAMERLAAELIPTRPEPRGPDTATAAVVERLTAELIPTRPEPYQPRTAPITPERATANRRALARSIGVRTAA
ncbi:WhiB family transcriptional regulator [Streptomyces sp. NRRL F-5123]|uniref:WhiB family transcriptional regulator n=1 Tax=Streptomyces sp. NRRL F-5123 TaxID=1463856 RepID=UPI00069423FE|nr:WhiB family transcriptional regulator [Streptomyces sp. NRRL F-5123]